MQTCCSLKKEIQNRADTREQGTSATQPGIRRRAARTHYHARADIAEFRLLAVVVLELVRPVIDRFDWFYGRRFILFLLLDLFVINEVHLQK